MIIFLGFLFLILEGVITNYFSYVPFYYSVHVSLVLLYLLSLPFFYKKNDTFYLNLYFSYGIIYDLFYTNVYFWHSLNYILMYYIFKYLRKKGVFQFLTFLICFFFSISFDYLLAIILYKSPSYFYFSYLKQYLLSNVIFFFIFFIGLGLFYRNNLLKRKR